jgi:hypothetical protein
MRSIRHLISLVVVFATVNAQTQTVTTDEGTYDLKNTKGDTNNADIGTNEAAHTSVDESGGSGGGQDIGGHGNIVSGGQTNSDGSYNGYGNLNHDINSSYNGNTIINNYAKAPKVTCIGDWCIEDPPSNLQAPACCLPRWYLPD